MADDTNSMAGTADVGARYAQAFFDLADDKKMVAAVEQDLKELKAMIGESADLRRVIASPIFAAEDKAKALSAIADDAHFNPLTKKFLGLLGRNGRIAATPAAIAAFEKLAAARRGAVAAEVTTAVPLSEAQQTGHLRRPCARRSARTPNSRPTSTPPSSAG